MKMDIKFNGNYTLDCQYSPNAEILGNPEVKFKIKISNKYIDNASLDKYYDLISQVIIVRIKDLFELVKSTIIKQK